MLRHCYIGGPMLAFVFLLLSTTLVAGACSSRDPADVASLVPADAVAAVIAPPLDELRGPLIGFADGMEGAEGVIEWVARRYGVDLLGDRPFADIGVDARAGLVIYARDGLLFVALGVADAKAFDGHIARQLALFGYAPAERVGEEPSLRRAVDRGTAGVPPVAWGVHERRAVLAFSLDGVRKRTDNTSAPTSDPAADPASGPTSDPVGAVRAALTTPPSAPLVASERFRRLTGDEAGAAEADGEQPAVVRGWVDLERTVLTPQAVNALLAPLGFAQGFARPTVDGFDALGLRLTVTPARLSLAARVGRRAGAAPLAIEWLRPASDAPDFGDLLPSSTGLFLRARMNAEKLAGLPSFLRNMVFGANPFATWHPFAGALVLGEDVVPFWTGDLAIAVLGLSDTASLASLNAALLEPARLVAELDLALLLRVRDPAAFAARIDERVTAARAAGARADALPAKEANAIEGVRAWRLVGGHVRHLGVALSGDVAVVTVGRDALGRVLRVLEGEAPSLDARARGALDEAAVGATDAVLAGHASFDRVARQLQCKGFPPYFLKVMTSPDVMAFRLRVGAPGGSGAGESGGTPLPTFELEVTQ